MSITLTCSPIRNAIGVVALVRPATRRAAKLAATAAEPKITEVVIDKDGTKETYTSLEKVPAEMRARVKELAEIGAGKRSRPRF